MRDAFHPLILFGPRHSLLKCLRSCSKCLCSCSERHTQAANLTAADISNSSGPDTALHYIPSLTSYLALGVCQICIWQREGASLHS